jgi:hypothetical protein
VAGEVQDQLLDTRAVDDAGDRFEDPVVGDGLAVVYR